MSIRSIFVIILLWFNYQLATAHAAPLFSYTDAKLNADTKQGQPTSDVQWDILLSEGAKNLVVGDRLQIPLPNGSVAQVTITARQRAGAGNLNLLGEFGEQGSLVLTIGKTAVYGNISNANMRYAISQIDASTLRLIDTHKAGEFDLDNDFRLPVKTKIPGQSSDIKTQPSMEQLKQLAETTAGVTIIDFLAVYSPEFRAVFPSPTTKIEQLLSFTNDALTRSGVLIQLRLVAARELDFNNAASLDTNLNAATNGTGAFTSLPAIRDSVGADMVGVLHGNPGFSASGIAWVNGDSPDFAFSATRLSPGCCDSVFAHEIGHNLGSGHEHAAVNPGAGNPCTGFFLPYACGHGAADRSWGTVMSRLNDEAIGFRFSNLDFDCLGDRCGVPEGQSNPADNRRAFNMSRLLIRDFRPTANACVGLTASKPCWLPAVTSLLLD